jgi:hypothetical protein
VSAEGAGRSASSRPTASTKAACAFRSACHSAPKARLTPRAWARAYLWSTCDILDLLDAVDPLQEYAQQSGLVADIGQDVVQAIIECAFSLVIVDTSAAFFEGDDENSNAQQGAHARRLRNLVTLSGGPTVIIAAHPPKNAGDDNLQPRGGGAFIAEVDGNLTAKRDDVGVELHWQGKFRGPDFAPNSFVLRGVTHHSLKDTQGRSIPTVVESYVSEAAQDELAAVQRHDENNVLTAYLAKPEASRSDIARSLGWLLGDGKTPHKMKVQRAIAKLKDAKLVTIAGRRLDKLLNQVRDTPASTLDELRAKARICDMRSEEDIAESIMRIS